MVTRQGRRLAPCVATSAAEGSTVRETAGLRRGIRVLVILACVAVVLMLGLAVYSALRANDAAAERGTRLDPGATITALLLAQFVDQESAVWGYLVTEDPTFLEPYYE